MVATLTESLSLSQELPSRLPTDDTLVSRINTLVARIDALNETGHETRDRLDQLERRFNEVSHRQQDAMSEIGRLLSENFERDQVQRRDAELSERVGQAVRSAVQPEIHSLRSTMDAQAQRMAAVETRLERVETIQVESMNALDARFGDLGFQTRMALSAGGLVTLAAILVILLR